MDRSCNRARVAPRRVPHAGRRDAAKSATKAGLFDIMKAHFADQYQKQGLALSLEFVEFSESGTLKHNNLHARLRKT